MRALRPRRAGALLICALTVGCDGDCSAPRVVGGTEQERRTVQEEVAAFFDVVREPVCVRSVRIGPIPDLAGTYTHRTRRVRVDPEDARLLRQTVRHELCHALDRQNDLVAPDDPRWGLDPAFAERSDHYADRDPAWYAREAFALTCHQGPAVLHLFGDACPDDTPGTEAVAVVRDLFDVPPPIAAREVVREPRGGLSVAHLQRPRFTVTPTVQDTLRIGVSAGDHSEQWWVDPWTGASVAAALSAEVPVWAGEETWAPSSLGGVTTGEAHGLRLWGYAANGGVGQRLVYGDGDGFTRVGCPRAQEQVFAVDGRVWSAWLQDGEIVWGTWGIVPAEAGPAH